MCAIEEKGGRSQVSLPRQLRPIPLRPPALQQRRHKRQREGRDQVPRHERRLEAVVRVAREGGRVPAEGVRGKHSFWWFSSKVLELCVGLRGRGGVVVYPSCLRVLVCAGRVILVGGCGDGCAEM